MSSSPWLFVYGTLRTGFENRWARLLHASADCVIQAQVRGRLIRLKRYRGIQVTRRGGSYVDGELFRMRNPKKTLGALDIYEGPNYKRVLVTAESHRRQKCWIYEYTPTLLTRPDQVLDKEG